MAHNGLEKRVSILEQQVQELIREKRNGPGPMDWLSTVGMFSGNQYMKEIDSAAREYRDRDRRAARRRAKPKRKQAKS